MYNYLGTHIYSYKCNTKLLKFNNSLNQQVVKKSQSLDWRAVVCSASGEKMFSAGIDLAQLAGELGAIMGGDDVGRKAFQLRKMILRLQRPFNLIAECPKPVIAATFGGNIGGAIDLLAACDIRYCASDAWFTIKEVDVGLGK